MLFFVVQHLIMKKRKARKPCLRHRPRQRCGTMSVSWLNWLLPVVTSYASLAAGQYSRNFMYRKVLLVKALKARFKQDCPVDCTYNTAQANLKSSNWFSLQVFSCFVLTIFCRDTVSLPQQRTKQGQCLLSKTENYIFYPPFCLAPFSPK